MIDGSSKPNKKLHKNKKAKMNDKSNKITHFLFCF